MSGCGCGCDVEGEMAVDVMGEWMGGCWVGVEDRSKLKLELFFARARAKSGKELCFAGQVSRHINSMFNHLHYVRGCLIL